MSTDTPDLFDAPEVPASATAVTSSASAAPTTTAPMPADEGDTLAAATGADQPPPPAPPADPEREPGDDGTLALDRYAERAYLAYAMSVVKSRALPQVGCPVHAIYGRGDALYKEWIGALEGAYAAAAPNFRGLALIEDAGHWVQFERPQAFRQALLAALSAGAGAA